VVASPLAQRPSRFAASCCGIRDLLATTFSARDCTFGRNPLSFPDTRSIPGPSQEVKHESLVPVARRRPRRRAAPDRPHPSHFPSPRLSRR